MNLMDLNFRSFTNSTRSRGLEYFQKGKVAGLSYRNLVAKATVNGERDYRVSITFNKNGKIARASCSCPYGYDGYCKHIAATIYEIDYQRSEGFLDDDAGGEEMLTDAEKFCKECYNESYRIGYRDVPLFYENKEKEILLKGEKWSEKELIDCICYLYSLRLPMAIGQNSYSRYLAFMKGKDYSLKVRKETFSSIFARYSFFPFIKEAFQDPEFREVVNILLHESMAEEGELRDSIIYNLEEAGPYLSEENLLALLTETGPYYVDKEKLLSVYILRGFQEGIDALSSSRYLSSEIIYDLALYYESRGQKEKAKSFYKKVLSRSSSLGIELFASYWRNLSDEEKADEYPSLHEAARRGRCEKPVALLVGNGKKGDLRSLDIEDFLYLGEEIKKQFPEDYLNILLPKTERKLASSGYSKLEYKPALLLFDKYPLLLSSLLRKKNETLMIWFGEMDKRPGLLALLRDYGLLKEMHIHPYKEED